MKLHTDNLWIGFLDENNSIKNYLTEEYDNQNPIDMNTTGIEYYNRFLDKYMSAMNARIDGKTGTIVYMSPTEYFSEIAKHIYFQDKTGYTAQKLIETKQNDVQRVRQVLQSYNKKLCMPYIDYVSIAQEGCHRLLVVAEVFGWDYKVPVLVVKQV